MSRRRRLLDQLGVVAARIEKILNGQDVDLASLPLPQEATPGETPLERLRRFKALLQEALDELNRGEPRLCRACGEPISLQALDELPWATSCGACSGAPFG